MQGAKRSNQSAGMIMYSKKNGVLKFFLVHPGGPFWAKKHEGSWTIPKGEFEDKEDMIDTAKREMKEETGIEANEPLINLGFIKQKAGKIVHAWAFEGDYDGKFKCTSMVDMEYPPKSGKKIKFPEVDKGGMFSKEEAKNLINPAQYDFIEKLDNILKKENKE